MRSVLGDMSAKGIKGLLEVEVKFILGHRLIPLKNYFDDTAICRTVFL